MASVWLARIEGKHGFEKLVAIKTILPNLAADEYFERALLDEARIASRIEHMNVAQILDLGEQHNVLYVVIEWVEGDALSRLARAVEKRGLKLPPGIALRILSDTCGGLHAAHELRGIDGKPLGVVHRDVSPQNILVSNAGMAKLIDFGIAKARDRLVGETSAGVVKGKVRYMAPEQALGRPVDRRTDIFAVGTVLYRMLAGRAPYAAENELASLRLLTDGRPPAPLPASVHPSISAVVNRALAHRPEGRYATAAEMQAEIERAMVDAGLVTTTANVAAFTASFLGANAEKRKAATQTALAAAAERQRVRQVLTPMVSQETSTGVSRVGPGVQAAAAAAAPDGDDAVTVHLPPKTPAPIEPPPADDAPTVRIVTEPPARPKVATATPLRVPTAAAPVVRANIATEPPGRAQVAATPAAEDVAVSEPPPHLADTYVRVPLSRLSPRTSMIAAGGAVLFMVLVLMASRHKSSPPRPSKVASPQVTALAPPPAVVSAPLPTVTATADWTPAPLPAPSPTLSVVEATDVPRAVDTVPPPKPRPPVAKAPVAAPRVPAPESVNVNAVRAPAANRVDDGF